MRDPDDGVGGRRGTENGGVGRGAAGPQQADRIGQHESAGHRIAAGRDENRAAEEIGAVHGDGKGLQCRLP